MSVRMERFELRAFGPFTATTLELQGARGGDLHIICGPNEVGKSTAQRGIGDFLFGIPPRSTDNQIHEYVDMRLAAVLVDEHGRQHELVRRKGTRQTLLDANGEPVDEALLEGMLGGMTREVFESMFSITHESLVIGGKALLAADGKPRREPVQRQPRRDRLARAAGRARARGRRAVPAACDVERAASVPRGV